MEAQIVNRIIQLYHQDNSYLQISRIMGNVTRGKVQGILTRAIKAGHVKKRFDLNEKQIMENKIKIGTKDFKWDYEPLGVGVSLLDIKPDQCHFPCKDGLYCGAKIDNNNKKTFKQYCTEHHKVMIGDNDGK